MSGPAWSIVESDALEWLRSLPDDSADLLFTSPPYLQARTYGIDAGRDLDEWVPWMLEIIREASRVVRGLVAVNCEGQTRNYRYLPAPFLLAADLHRAGFNLRKPVVFHRIGIPGSGGPDWLRNDWEPVLCVTRPGKLPWSDPTACGHPPKWAPGGEMSHRQSNGSRVNQWGHPIASGATVVNGDGVVRSQGRRPSHHEHTKRMPNGEMKVQGYNVPVKANPGNVLRAELTAFEFAAILEEYGHVIGDDSGAVLRELRQAARSQAISRWFQGVLARLGSSAVLQPSVQGVVSTGRIASQRGGCEGEEAGAEVEAASGMRDVQPNGPARGSPQGRKPDEQRSVELGGSLPLVSPQGAQARRLFGVGMHDALLGSGLLQQALPAVQEVWRSAGEVFRQRQADEGADLITCQVGGGMMGHAAAHRNEAPFPLSLAEFFVQSFCPPGGLVVDPFSGSGTTAHAAVMHGRRFAGCDIRQSQVDLCKRRLATVTPSLFAEVH